MKAFKPFDLFAAVPFLGAADDGEERKVFTGGMQVEVVRVSFL